MNTSLALMLAISLEVALLTSAVRTRLAPPHAKAQPTTTTIKTIIITTIATRYQLPSLHQSLVI